MYGTRTQDGVIPARDILARYEDITVRHGARVDEIGDEFAQRLAAADTEAAERARLAAEAQAQAKLAAEQAEQAPEAKPTWERRQRPTVLSFGAEDETPAAAGPQPMVPPPPPPVAPPPAPEPPRRPVRSRVHSFGPVDDEDLSAQRWMR
ncbi:hypothetical protein [Actinokineospora sp. UTMC 2448]|uniref:hypothetical protein n=1 Tax=Actinokineospora sp. UTMC 2448 TaxID=2268449 RepID=UPI002164424F|nr:hypothetical protein [Actinokineospora sp. UTMC 2448]UVS82121.1 hypothetical protein Actkin_05886 [Actinokineospora sp. UTMC 2448]